MKMSAKLQASLEASERKRKTTKAPQSGVHNIRDLRLEKAADRILAKSGFFPKREIEDDVVVDANAISAHGHLRPTWTGRP